MARWSDAMKFDKSTLEEFRLRLDKFGVYELGVIRGEFFYPKYIGKASSQTLFVRLSQYFYLSKESKIPPGLRAHIHNTWNRVWFHVYCTDDAFLSEQLMLRRHLIGRDGGLYEWNRKYG